jgi:hypothetical protein
MTADFPITVAEWPRNSREIVRVNLDIYNNNHTVDARAWWTDAQGNLRPGRSGLTLSVRHLVALADGLGEAVRQARALGLIEPAVAEAPSAAGQRQGRLPLSNAERQRLYKERRRTGNASDNARDATLPLPREASLPLAESVE